MPLSANTYTSYLFSSVRSSKFKSRSKVYINFRRHIDHTLLIRDFLGTMAAITKTACVFKSSMHISLKKTLIKSAPERGLSAHSGNKMTYIMRVQHARVKTTRAFPYCYPLRSNQIHLSFFIYLLLYISQRLNRLNLGITMQVHVDRLARSSIRIAQWLPNFNFENKEV